jgi:hypothetical protein
VTVNPVPTETKTKDVTVSFPAFNLSTQPTTISLAPIFTPDSGWGTHFSADDIDWTITDNKGHINSDFPDGKIEIAKATTLYPEPEWNNSWPWPPPLFTIAFSDKNNGNKLGEYKVFIGDFGNNGYFNLVAEDNGNNAYDGVGGGNDIKVNGDLVPTTPLTLTLSKQVTE